MEPPENVVPPAGVEATRWVAVASLLALIALGIAWELWLAPLRPGGSWLALKVVPLVVPLPGLLRRRMYTYRWVSLMVWLYFIEGAVRATSLGSDRGASVPFAVAEVILSLVLFAACALHVRLRLGPRKRGGRNDEPSLRDPRPDGDAALPGSPKAGSPGFPPPRE